MQKSIAQVCGLFQTRNTPTFYFYFYLLLFQTRNTPIFYLGPTFNLSSGSKLGLSEYHLCPKRPGFEPEETAVIVVNSPTGVGLPFIWQIFRSERTYFRKHLCVISSGICPTKEMLICRLKKLKPLSELNL